MCFVLFSVHLFVVVVCFLGVVVFLLWFLCGGFCVGFFFFFFFFFCVCVCVCCVCAVCAGFVRFLVCVVFLFVCYVFLFVSFIYFCGGVVFIDGEFKVIG